MRLVVCTFAKLWENFSCNTLLVMEKSKSIFSSQFHMEQIKMQSVLLLLSCKVRFSTNLSVHPSIYQQG